MITMTRTELGAGTTRARGRYALAAVLCATVVAAPVPVRAQPAPGESRAVLERIRQEQQKTAATLEEAIATLKNFESTRDTYYRGVGDNRGLPAKSFEEALQPYQRRVNELTATHRQLVAAEIAAATNPLSTDDSRRVYSERESEIMKRQEEVRARLRAEEEQLHAHLNDLTTTAGYPEKEIDKEKALVESRLKRLRAEDELLGEALRATRWEQTVNYFQEKRPDSSNFFTNDGITGRMAELLDRISKTYIEDPKQKTSDLDRWFQTTDRERAVEEYVRLARNGLFVDPATGRPIGGQERTYIARNALLQLLQCLKRKGIEPTRFQALRGITDSRLQVAQRIDDIIESDEAYRILPFTNPGDEDMSQLFKGLTRFVRDEQRQVEEWRVKLIAGGDVTLPVVGTVAVPEWLAKQRVGLGTGIRLSGYVPPEQARAEGRTPAAGSDDFTAVDLRIEAFEREADAVVAAFEAAATTPNARNLTPDQYALLKTHGFIVEDRDGSASYQMPTTLRTGARLKQGLDLPGSILLDVISGENLIKAVAMTAAPQLVGGRVALALLKREGTDVVGAAGGRGGLLTYTCQHLWETGAFVATWERQTIPSCQDEIHEMAANFFSTVLASVKSNPALWTWVPQPDQVDQKSVHELLDLKARAVALMAREGLRI